MNARYGVTLGKLAIVRPLEFYDRVQGRREAPTPIDQRLRLASSAVSIDSVHRLLGEPVSGRCNTCRGFPEALAEVQASLGSGWNPGDAGLRLRSLLWSIVRHSRPKVVVETGVARGVTSAITLAALEANGDGRLWSIDLPPLSGDDAGQWGAAVSERLRGRWTLIRGSSKRRLPPLLRRLGVVDLFVHDSLHSYSNMRLEFATAWPYIRPDGYLVSDDANYNTAFLEHAHDVGERSPLFIAETDKADVIGILRKPSAER